MSDTFKFWLTANLGIILTITVFAVCALLAFVFGGSEFRDFLNDEDSWGLIFLILFLAAAFIAFPGKTISESITLYIIVCPVFAVFALSVNEPDTDDLFSAAVRHGYLVYSCVSLVGSWIVAGLLMPFINANIDEIVSRSMRFRNSNVDLFEFKWKYMIALFLDISRAVFANALILGFVICVLMN